MSCFRAGDPDHLLRKVNTKNVSPPVVQLAGEIPRAATCIENSDTSHVPYKLPENGVGIEDTIAIPIITNLSIPVIRDAIPQQSCFVRILIHIFTVERLLKRLAAYKQMNKINYIEFPGCKLPESSVYIH
ncbi:hypothetical protein AM1_3377 [Acaryochloris marina MBIC11017]|uniref:Uncharacterized protein n=1 Tax=Acaryochloris marina (strain MBIC 11017) TaxID=329726 RepID=B0C024_ACAM1|nr:hypothetical protein AM1_3377 [Acaryochloris marina MBIC11017]